MKSKVWLILLLGLVLALAACGGSEEKNDVPSTYTTLDVNAAYERFQQSDGAVIVDVREPNEWATTGVPQGAQLIPLANFTPQSVPSELPKDKEIFVICNSGNRSRVASQALLDNGYAKVVNVDGGIQAWMRAGLPVQPYTP